MKRLIAGTGIIAASLFVGLSGTASAQAAGPAEVETAVSAMSAPLPDFCRPWDMDDGNIFWDYQSTIGDWNYYIYTVHLTGETGWTNCTENFGV